MNATIKRMMIRTLPLTSFLTLAVSLLSALMLMSAPASAKVSASVRNACMGDYFQFCAGMEVGSPELRRCFNRNGAKLSSSCVSALVAAGEVSQAEVNRRSGASKVASKPSGAKKVAARAQCVQGPARPGAAASSSCKGRATASRGGRGKRDLVTLR